MSLNNLLAAPGFASWLEGDPLEVGSILRTSDGKPRVAIFSIAHLSDAERMFFVTLLLNQTVAWMRTQSGTTSLRAILYMDEIAGYFPPVATPPAKAPLLTLLKQGRAFGLGVVLATQNPVDLDYKGLANTGTWFLGRLQTERDKARVLEGLEGAAASASQKFDRGKMEQTLAALGSRVFLLNNVHEDAPEVFETRWALSYLRGPLTRAQIKTLMDPRRGAEAKARPAKAKTKAASAASPAGGPRPVLPPGVTQLFVPARGAEGGIVYRAAVLGDAEVYFADGKRGLSATRTVSRVAPLAAPLDWSAGEEPDFAGGDLEAEPAGGSTFADAGAALGGKSAETWSRDFAAWIYRESTVDLWKSPSAGVISKPGESEADFRARLQQEAREKRDAAADRLREKYATRLASLQERLRRAQQAVGREKQESMQAGVQTAISVGATVLGAIFGRKTISSATIGKATTAARSAGRTMKQAGDVQRAEETEGAIQQQIAALEGELQAELAAQASATDPLSEALEKVALRPKKTDITVRRVVLVWEPYRGGEPAWS
jgi:hypothetical protein